MRKERSRHQDLKTTGWMFTPKHSAECVRMCQVWLFKIRLFDLGFYVADSKRSSYFLTAEYFHNTCFIEICVGLVFRPN